jgi:hypothetical protein
MALDLYSTILMQTELRVGGESFSNHLNLSKGKIFKKLKKNE